MKRTIAVFCLLGAATLVHAQVTVKDAWARATVPQQQATGAFMQLTAAKPARVVEVRSPAASVTEIHEMSMAADHVMKMRPVKSLELPAGKTVELKPGGYHVMLMGLKSQIKAGDSVPLTLVVEGQDGKRENVDVKVSVRPLTASSDEHKGH